MDVYHKIYNSSLAKSQNQSSFHFPWLLTKGKRNLCTMSNNKVDRFYILNNPAKGKFMYEARGLEYCTYLQLVR